MIINTNNIEEAKRLIKKAEKASKPIIIKSQDDLFNRKIIEYGKFEILIDLEYNRKDSFRQINSGLNDFLAKTASKNNIALGIDLKRLKNLDKKDKAIILSKIMQNIKICKKAKAKIKLLNIESKPQALSLMLSLGSSTKQASEALN